ncbi:hypothetical protein PMI04_014865 [Sphingobium sp. AP49]|uniref:hypothetical protein n=1 Tax=Sphingobium sp. AP49 TaxID=1144307 RepID=UPI00026EE739|nr:hypothetical protein [Sphingobium sp. AP49]WHO37841.1 hypothetical protein PMI04_014865 [Sphingobium sp. AP49]
MSGFDLVFAAFGLLLGLAITEVLGGFSRALKLKRAAKPVRIGWLTPLLGLFVLLDLTSFWLTAFEERDAMGADYLTLVAVLAIVGVYYLAATLIFPDDPEQWPDFDDWYDRHKRMVIGGLLAANVGSIIGQIVLGATAEDTAAADTLAIGAAAAAEPAMSAMAETIMGLALLSLFLLLGALLVIRSRRWNIVMLLVLVLLLPSASIYLDQV